MQPPPRETPLESWKAIAAYLQRDVRTVKRWESSEGLHVHRHRHLAGSTVYAYASELDVWRATRRPVAVPAAGGLLNRRARTLALASVAILALVSVGDNRVIGPVRTGAQDRGMTVRQVWTGTDVDITGAPTPDGRFLTFTDWSTGDVAVRNLATGEKRRITNKGSWASSAEYADYSIVSPDGKHVAYSWDNKDRLWELRIAAFSETAASAPRVVYRNEDVNYIEPFTWAPDGKDILTLLQRKDRTLQMALVAVADGSMRVLKSLEWRWPSKMSFSPDGRYVAYDARVRQDSPDRDIFVLAVDGSQEAPVVQHPAIDYAPVWMPDGQHIMFLSDRRGRTALWMIQVAAVKPLGTVELLKADIGAISPLGLFSFTRDGSFYYGVYTGTEDVYTAELSPQTGEIAGAPARVTERFTGSNLAGVWSPDGRRFSYFSRRGPLLQSPGNMAVVVRSVDTGEEQEFFSNLEFHRNWPSARWFPDGRSLLLSTLDNLGRSTLQRMDIGTGAVEPLTNTRSASDGARAGNAGPLPSISPDGRTIYYFPGADANETSPIMAYDIASGSQRAIAGSPVFGQQLWSMALSRDGKRLAVTGRALLQIVPTDGGAARDVFRATPPNSLTRSGLAWTADDRFLLFTQRAGDLGSQSFWRVSADGGQPEKVRTKGLAFPSVHPDGRHIAFTAGMSEGAEVWVMQNVLPAPQAAR
jgi:Tol biopolymer transport system component